MKSLSNFPVSKIAAISVILLLTCACHGKSNRMQNTVRGVEAYKNGDFAAGEEYLLRAAESSGNGWPELALAHIALMNRSGRPVADAGKLAIDWLEKLDLTGANELSKADYYFYLGTAQLMAGDRQRAGQAISAVCGHSLKMAHENCVQSFMELTEQYAFETRSRLDEEKLYLFAATQYQLDSNDVYAAYAVEGAALFDVDFASKIKKNYEQSGVVKSSLTGRYFATIKKLIMNESWRSLAERQALISHKSDCEELITAP